MKSLTTFRDTKLSVNLALNITRVENGHIQNITINLIYLARFLLWVWGVRQQAGRVTFTLEQTVTAWVTGIKQSTVFNLLDIGFVSLKWGLLT